MRLRLLALALVLPALVPTGARAAHLTTTTYGALDFGDRIAYHLTGHRCTRARVRVRALAGPSRHVVAGPRSRPLRAAGGGCAGLARVPMWTAVHATGWREGEPLALKLRSGARSVPLRFARLEVDQGTPAAGSPQVVAADDPDTAPGDRALALGPGDAVGLGRVDLRRVDSVALRLCVTGTGNPVMPGGLGGISPNRVEPPVFVSLHEDGPSGPALVGPVDVAESGDNPGRLASLGFGGCYRLVVLPLAHQPSENAPSLFLSVDAAPPGVLKVNTLDIDGTAAKAAPARPRGPRHMRTIFNGSSFVGFTQTGCALRDGAAVNARNGDPTQMTPCSLTYNSPIHDVVVRLQVRAHNFYDNAGIFLGPQEIQLRRAGEYLPGGYIGQLAARWEKLDTYPRWSNVEIVQLGARHVVSIDGRTVTDVMRAGGAPAPYKLQFLTQPEFSERAGGSAGFGDESGGAATTPSEWGAFEFRRIRLLQCASETDPACRALADARRGEVPVPAGAPPPQSPRKRGR